MWLELSGGNYGLVLVDKGIVAVRMLEFGEDEECILRVTGLTQKKIDIYLGRIEPEPEEKKDRNVRESLIHYFEGAEKRAVARGLLRRGDSIKFVKMITEFTQEQIDEIIAGKKEEDYDLE